MKKMKLKLTLLFTALCCMAMAQDFHGVTLGGTTLQPTLINGSDQAVLAYVIRRDSTKAVGDPTPGGTSFTHPIFPSDRIMTDRTIKPGEESPIGGMLLGLTLASEGDSLGYTLTGVMFADGTFLGQNPGSIPASQKASWENGYLQHYGKAPVPGDFEKFIHAQNAGFAQLFQHEVEFYRSYAGSIKGSADRLDAIHQDANLPKTKIDGVDMDQQRRRRAAARLLSGVLMVKGPDEVDKALDRLSKLADVKGVQ